MRRTVVALLSLTLLLCLAGCASSNDEPPAQRPRARGGDGWRGGAPGGGYAGGGFGGGGIQEMIPPAQWWHDTHIAGAVNLTPDQISALDRLGDADRDEIAKIERDSAVAVRELRDLLESQSPARDAIVAAGQRIRSLRDAAFDHQITVLASERAILSADQWKTLQQTIAASRRPANDDYRGRGGRGGYGGRGRRPGFPG